MKRFLGFLSLVIFASALMLIGCRKVVKADVRAIVDEISDSVLVAKIGDAKVKFDITDCRFTNGAIMYGDSVIINYVGDLDEKRALAETVHLIDRLSPTVPVGVVDTTLELKTSDAEPEKIQAIDRLVETAKRLQDMKNK